MKFLLLISSLHMITVSPQEVEQPAGLLGPRNYNHHPYEAVRYLSQLSQPEPTKQGPVLFPRDGPPPPKPPLIVTSRPLIEQIARSELNPNPVDLNNSIAEQSQINRVQLQPNYLARINQYTPYNYNYVSPTPAILVDSLTGKPVSLHDYQSPGYNNPYADVVRKSQVLHADIDRGHRYNQYEEKSVLPPIYKALADHAQQNVLKIQQKKLQSAPYRDYQVKEPDYQNNDYSYENQNDNGINNEYNKGKKYAFSYSVRDHSTGDDFSHRQHSSGQATNGEYRVRLPDGRMQIVSYIADENGYKADGKKYAFSYSVRDHSTGDDFSHRQHSSGQATNGEYRVRLPDGRMQIVSYIADENGYKADVRYDDHTEDKTYGNTIENQNNVHNNINKQDVNKVKEVNVNNDYNNYNPYLDDSKEYYNNDYSDYNDKNYNTRKFSAFEPKTNNKKIGVIVVPNQFKQSTVRPSYEQLKPLFVTKKPYQVVSSSQNYEYQRIPVEINVPSTTVNSLIYDEITTERVVLIGGSPKTPLYTNIRHSIPSAPVTTPSPLVNYVTPTFFLSTASPLLTKNVDFSNNKAVLTSGFLDRIQKYLTFT